MLRLEPAQALALVERIGAVAILISSLEMLVRPRLFAPAGLLSWEAAQLRTGWLTHGPLARAFDALFRAPAVLWLVAVRALAAVVVVVSVSPPFSAVVAVAAATLLLMLRTSYGNDGADQIGAITFSAAALAHLRPTTEVIVAVLWFVALQACLAYLTSGVAKLAGRRWRDGTGLMGVLTTRSYGSVALAGALGKYRGVAVAASWMVILGESLFPAVLVAPVPVMVGILLFGLVFHAGTAAVMGLNTFLWAFLATYPAIWYCALAWR